MDDNVLYDCDQCGRGLGADEVIWQRDGSSKIPLCARCYTFRRINDLDARLAALEASAGAKGVEARMATPEEVRLHDVGVVWQVIDALKAENAELSRRLDAKPTPTKQFNNIDDLLAGMTEEGWSQWLDAFKSGGICKEEALANILESLKIWSQPDKPTQRQPTYTYAEYMKQFLPTAYELARQEGLSSEQVGEDIAEQAILDLQRRIKEDLNNG